MTSRAAIAAMRRIVRATTVKPKVPPQVVNRQVKVPNKDEGLEFVGYTLASMGITFGVFYVVAQTLRP